MTEFWVSQKNKWCEYCRCWLKDTTQSWAVHERGIGHKENVARKLREMRQTADREKRDKEQLDVAMQRVEAEAARRFKGDQKAEEAHRKAKLGSWEWNAGTGYFYNAQHRWYYDKTTGMYYGGEPVQWTDSPTMPHEARYEVMNKPKPPPVPEGAAAGGGGTSGAPPVAAAVAQKPAGARPVVAGQQYAVAGSRIVNKHPLSQVGGYQLHMLEGSVGGAKGVGLSAGGGADGKRKRDGGAAGGEGKELTKEEQEFLARREAARQRVQQRTAATFGL